MLKRFKIDCFLFVVAFLLIGFSISQAANAVSTGNNYSIATVDTAPGASGYATGAVCIGSTIYKGNLIQEMEFFVSGDGTGAVTLQWQRTGDGETWVDYSDGGTPTYGVGETVIIRGGAATKWWRGICKNGALGTSTEIVFGFEWAKR